MARLDFTLKTLSYVFNTAIIAILLIFTSIKRQVSLLHQDDFRSVRRRERKIYLTDRYYVIYVVSIVSYIYIGFHVNTTKVFSFHCAHPTQHYIYIPIFTCRYAVVHQSFRRL